MSTPAPAAPNEYQPVQPMSPSDEKLWSTLIHIGGIFFSFVPALIGYLVLKDRGPFINAHTKTALNFQISVALYGIALGIISVIFILVTFGFGAAIVTPVAGAYGIAIMVFCIIAAVKANGGQFYKYPLTIEFIK